MGWEINREKPTDKFSSFVLPKSDESVTSMPAVGGSMGFTLDFDGTMKTEGELIVKYREMAFHPEVDSAIDDIVNEAIVTDDQVDPPVAINLENLELPDNIKAVIEQEFQHIINLLKFNKKAYEIFRSWYIDGRKFYHIVIDEEHPELGIQALMEIDALKLRKIREVTQVPSEEGGTLQNVVNEYYLYNERGFISSAASPTAFFNTNAGINSTRIASDAILVATSGLMNENGTMVLSYLQPAVRPLNQLRMLEDASIIYRLVRAPARRAFYVDVGGLPKQKAEQYVRDMMVSQTNKVNYDSSTGQISDGRKFMTLLDDYWLPQREGQGTKIETLAGTTDFTQLDDINYFLAKVYKALKVPITRTDPGSGFNIGRPSEITRDELKFTKFVSRLRFQFANLFSNALEKQLVLRQVISPEEWEQIEPNIKYTFTDDNYFENLKDSEILRDKAATTAQLMPFVDQFFSRRFVWKNVWQMSDEDIMAMMVEIQQDMKTFGPINPMEESTNLDLLNTIKEDT